MIAISYRRDDSLPIAGRLYDRLQAKFGKRNVFMDFDSIPPGVDFREQIKQTIERSNLVIAVIGPNWLGEQNDSRRIDDPADFVRLEIAYALNRGIPVIPLLVDNTLMPKAESLPPDIAALAFRNALPLDSGIDFHSHTDRLIVGIRRALRDAPPPSQKKAVGPVQSAASWRGRRRIIVTWGATILVAAAAALAAWRLVLSGQVERPARQGELDKATSLTPPVFPDVSSAPPLLFPEHSPRPSQTTPQQQTPTPSALTPTSPPFVPPEPRSPMDLPKHVDETPLWPGELRQFIRHFAAATDQSNVDIIASFYAETADIFDEGLKTQDSIRPYLKAHNDHWPTRSTEVRDPIHFKEEIPNQQYAANFKEHYSFESQTRNEWEIGTLDIDLKIVIREGSRKISSIKQTVLSRKSGVGKTPEFVKVYVKRLGVSLLLPIAFFGEDPHDDDGYFSAPNARGVAIWGQKGTVKDYYNAQTTSSNIVVQSKIFKDTWCIIAGTTLIPGRGFYSKAVKKERGILVMSVVYTDEKCPFSEETLRTMGQSFTGESTVAPPSPSADSPTPSVSPSSTNATSQANSSWESAATKANWRHTEQKLVRVYAKRVGFHVLLPSEIYPDAAELSQKEEVILLDREASLFFNPTTETLKQAYERFSGDNGWEGSSLYYKFLGKHSFTVWRQGVFASGVEREGEVMLMNVWYRGDCPFNVETLKAMSASFMAAK